MLTIQLNDLHIISDGKDLGHVIDAIRSGTCDASEAKAALDLAWIGKQEQVNDHARTIAVLQSEVAAANEE